jgi:hypothetical protein
MRAPSLLLATILLAGCSAAPGGSPALAIIPSTPEPASAPPSSSAAPQHASRWAGIDRVKEALRVSGGGRQTIALEGKGRLVVTDIKEGVENELQLEDVARLDYSHERDRDRPHCVQIRFKTDPGVAERTRWRTGNGEWMISSSSYLPLCVADKAAADDIVAALGLLLTR